MLASRWKLHLIHDSHALHNRINVFIALRTTPVIPARDLTRPTVDARSIVLKLGLSGKIDKERYFFWIRCEDLGAILGRVLGLRRALELVLANDSVVKFPCSDEKPQDQI